MNNNLNQSEFNPKLFRLIIASVVGFVLLIIVIFKSSVTIESGHAGVLYQKFGEGTVMDQVYDEGFHIIAPWNNMIIYEVRQQELKESMSVLSSNGLDIKIDVSAWYLPLREKLPYLHRDKGKDYLTRVLMPSIRSATRGVIGRYAPEEIYSTKRNVIQSEIHEETKKVLKDQYVQLNRVMVRNISLPPKIKQAIEKKLKQEQEFKEYKFKLQKEKKEAERLKIAAEGKARANEILNASLTDNILKEKGIDATIELAKSPNSKVIVIGNSEESMPIILGSGK